MGALSLGIVGHDGVEEGELKTTAHHGLLGRANLGWDCDAQRLDP